MCVCVFPILISLIICTLIALISYVAPNVLKVFFFSFLDVSTALYTRILLRLAD